MTFFDIDYNQSESNVIKEILFALDKGEDPSIQGDWAIGSLAENGYLKAIKIIMKDARVNYQAQDQYALSIAAMNKKYDVVKYLLSLKPVIKENDLRALYYALNGGDIKLSKMLLSYKPFSGWLESFPDLFSNAKQKNTIKKLRVGKYADLLR